jgi:hypothetical protein
VTELPATLDGYRLDEVLREAAATTTYAGVEIARGTQVVVKELRVGGRWKEYDLFVREVEALRALRHPGIPRFLDEVQTEHPGDLRLYLVMERAPGEPLSARITRGAPMGLAQALRIFEGVLEILEYLHGLAPPLLHRDVKPSNVLIGSERVYLVDFGGVKRFLPFAEDGSTVVGTFGYIAPEVLHGEVTPASDLYSLGATVAAVLAGCEASLCPRAGLRIDIARIPAARPPLSDVLRRLLEPDPARRLRSVAEVRAALRGESARRALPEHPPAPAALPRLFWVHRSVARWGLFFFGCMSFAAAMALEVVRSIGEFLIPGLARGAMGFCLVGSISVALSLLVRSKGACRRQILRMARRGDGEVELADVVHRLRLPPERARELLGELRMAGRLPPNAKMKTP